MFSLVLCHILVYVIPVYVAIGFIRSSLCCSGLCRGKVYICRSGLFVRVHVVQNTCQCTVTQNSPTSQLLLFWQNLKLPLTSHIDEKYVAKN